MKYFFIALIICVNIIYSQPNDSNFWELTNGPFGQKITTIDILNQDSIIVGTNGSGIFLYITSTSTWKNIYSDSRFSYIYSAIVTPSKDILFTAKNGSNSNSTIIKIYSDLNSWKLSETSGVGKFANIIDTLQNFILLTTQWNGIYKSTDNGDTWEINNYMNSPNGLGVKDIQYDSTLNRIVVATDGTMDSQTLAKTNYLDNGILFSDDLGEEYYNALDGYFEDVILNQNGLIFAKTDSFDETIYRSFDNGANWEEIPPQQYFQCIIIVSDNILYALNKKGLFISKDYGTTWELINSSVTDLNTLKCINDSTLYIGSTDGFYEYSTVLNKYTNLTEGLYASNIWSLFASQSGKIIAGSGGTVFYTKNAGVKWETAPTLPFWGDKYIEDINTFTETSNGRLFVGTDRAFFYYTDNIVTQWMREDEYYFNGDPEIWSMATNSKDEIYVGTSNEGIVIINEDAREFRTTPILGQYILALDIGKNDEVYAGSLYGTVFFTTENANNWHAKSDGLNNLPIISVKKSNNLYACTISSVHKYNEETQYWDNVGIGLPPNTFLSEMIVVGNTIYISSRGSGVYYTTDEGKNWKTFNTGLDNTDITAIINDSTGYLYVASMKGIYRTNDKIVSVKREPNSSSIPEELILNNVYPNPFNLTANIGFSNPKLQNIIISIYNVLGEEVNLIVDKEFLPGNYNFTWKGKNHFNSIVNSGVYFVKLNTANKQIIQKFILLK